MYNNRWFVIYEELSYLNFSSSLIMKTIFSFKNSFSHVVGQLLLYRATHSQLISRNLKFQISSSHILFPHSQKHYAEYQIHNVQLWLFWQICRYYSVMLLEYSCDLLILRSYFVRSHDIYSFKNVTIMLIML